MAEKLKRAHSNGRPFDQVFYIATTTRQRELLEATLIKAINPSQNRQAPHCGRDGRQPHHRLDAAIISGGDIMKRKPVSPAQPKRCLPTMEA